jgi:hypothetical protein
MHLRERFLLGRAVEADAVLTLTSGLYNKSFTIVIYDRNDGTIVEPFL